MNQKNRFITMALLATFIIPMVVSWILYYNYPHFHLKTNNHGVLLNPPIQISATEKKWRIIYLPGQQCDLHCERLNYQLHQIQKALGKDYQRVAVYKLRDDNQIPAAFAKQNHSAFATADKVYLTDPLGNIFMYYPSSTNPMDILKDLKKVLEVSQIG